MKTKYLALILTMFWIGVLGVAFFILHALLKSSTDIGVGVIIGIIWAAGTFKVIKVIEESITDLKDWWIRDE